MFAIIRTYLWKPRDVLVIHDQDQHIDYLNAQTTVVHGITETIRLCSNVLVLSRQPTWVHPTSPVAVFFVTNRLSSVFMVTFVRFCVTETDRWMPIIC